MQAWWADENSLENITNLIVKKPLAGSVVLSIFVLDLVISILIF